MKRPSPLSNEDIITTLREVEVPEPSPLFWDHLSKRVHDAVAAEPVPTASWTHRFNFAWAGGIAAALAMAVLAVTLSVRHQPAASGSDAAAVPSIAAAAAVSNALPPLEDDASWAVMGELASEMDFEQAGAAGLIVSPGAAEGALSQLSGDEQRAVVELLQEEIKNSKSL
jgi:hypothetical protein